MRVGTNGIEIEYKTFGEPHDQRGSPLVLVTGFSQQLIRWDERFCALLAARGFFVVVFDNRDAGLSTKMDGASWPNLPAIFSGDTSTLAYTIDEMADDTAGLIHSVAGGSAHVVGLSMGGMIVQSLAIRHASRVRSLTSIMSTTGNREVGRASPEAMSALMMPASKDREKNIENSVAAWRVIRSPGYPFDEDAVRAFVTRAYDRRYCPEGSLRQAAAILAQRDRTDDLRRVTVPTLVIHGADDPLIHVSGGQATADAVPGAQLLVIPGMGHDMPEPLWGLIVDAIADNARRAAGSGR
jgi:pimeloyl-ACP methyl ester carboxylesterase